MKLTQADSIPEFCLLVREKRGLSTRDFADEIGVSFTTVSRVERGLVELPFSYVKKLRPYLSVDEWEFIKDKFWEDVK